MFRGTNVLFKDISLLLAVGLLAIIVLLLPYINEKKKEEAEIKSPGKLIVEIFWPDERNVDVDLWIQSPQDSRPVSYARKDGFIFSLLRDDLGYTRDMFGANGEIAFARGTVPGEYIVNIHYFKSHDQTAKYPVTVKVKVTLRKNSTNKVIFEGFTELRREGQEKTAIRFKIDADGNWVNGSNSALPYMLRTEGRI